jgi:hypothetical protein
VAISTHVALVVFDEPRLKEGQYGSFYSMCISLPDGAPGTKYNEKYDRHEAWLSFDEDKDEFDYLMSLSKGDELQVIYDGKRSRYTAVVPADYHRASATTAPGSGHSGRGPAAEPIQQPVPTAPAGGRNRYAMSHVETLGLAQLAGQSADVILRVFEQVTADERALDMSGDERLRVAISAFIEARRQWPAAREEMVNLTLRRALADIDPDGLPDDLLNLIAAYVPFFEGDAERVRAVFNALGLTRKDIDPEDRETWLEVFRIAADYAAQQDVTPLKAGDEIPF